MRPRAAVLSCGVQDRIREEFQKNFDERGEIGASLSLWQNGQEVLSLHDGHRDRARNLPWEADTVVPIWSATKGPAAATVLLALHEAGHILEDPVVDSWPELATGHKEELTFGQMLSHRGGLAALDQAASITDYPSVIEALHAQAPNWEIGSAHGYHARTIGFLFDETVRRLTGAESLGAWWREKIADPMGLDLWIGLPESEDDRVAELIPGRGSSGNPPEFYAAFYDKESLTRNAFVSPRGLNAVADLNDPAAWRLGLPAMGGIGSAHALGKFYAMMAADGAWDGARILPESICRWAETSLSHGGDEILRTPTAFSAGFMQDPLDESGQKIRQLFGPSTRAFGHPGAGGSHGFADPENGIAFARVMNQMELSLFPTERTQSLIQAIYTA